MNASDFTAYKNQSIERLMHLWRTQGFTYQCDGDLKRVKVGVK